MREFNGEMMSKTLARALRIAPSEAVGWDYIDNREPDDPYRVHIIRGTSQPWCNTFIGTDEPRVMSATEFLYHPARCTRCEIKIRQQEKCTCFHSDPRPSCHHADYCDMRDDNMDNPYNTGAVKIQGASI